MKESYKNTGKLIFCTSDALSNIRLEAGNFSCWLHFHVPGWVGFAKAIRHLAENKCALFHASGTDSPESHDRIDDVLDELGKSEILTSWDEGNISEAAAGYWDMTIVEKEFQTKIICAIGANLDEELLLLREMAAGLQKASQAID